MSEMRSLPSLAVACSAVLVGCYAMTAEDPYDAPPEDDPAVFRQRGSQKATWFLVKLWTDRADSPAPDMDSSGSTPMIESFKQDVVAAGVRLTAAEPPERKHESLLLRKSQTGFAAIARDESLGAFAVGGRSFGGDGVRADLGLDIVPELLPDGRIALDVAPLFRGIEGIDGGEVRAHALSFGIVIADGSTILLESSRDAPDPVVRALFQDADSGRRKLWMQVELLR